MGSSTENSAFGITKNPVDSGSGAWRIFGRIRSSSGDGERTRRAWYRHRRFSAPAGELLWRRRTQANIRSSITFRRDCYGSSLDQIGTLTNAVSDSKTVFEVIQGKDPLDATTYERGIYPEVPKKEKYRIGIPRDFLKNGVDDAVIKDFEKSLAALAEDGHEVVDVSLPYMEKGLAAYYIVMPAEVSSNLARYDGMRFGLYVEGKDLLEDYTKTRAEGFGAEVKRRILLGTYVLSSGYYDAYYGKGEYVRALMRQEFESAFGDVDIIATPTTPTPAFTIGEKSDPLSMYLQDIFTVPANLTGVPAISVPSKIAKEDDASLPIGIQYIAPHTGEDRLFDIAGRFLGEW